LDNLYTDKVVLVLQVATHANISIIHIINLEAQAVKLVLVTIIVGNMTDYMYKLTDKFVLIK